MKQILVISLTFFLINLSYAQQPALKSEVVAEKKENTLAANYPKISLNNNKCRFEDLTLRKGQKNGFEIEIKFQRVCDKHRSVILHFDSLDEAFLVKDLVVKETDYELFNIDVDKEHKTTFQVLYNKTE
jgi:hypothetical protein